MKLITMLLNLLVRFNKIILKLSKHVYLRSNIVMDVILLYYILKKIYIYKCVCVRFN